MTELLDALVIDGTTIAEDGVKNVHHLIACAGLAFSAGALAQKVAGYTYPIAPCTAEDVTAGSRSCLFTPNEVPSASELAYRQAAGEPNWTEAHLKGGFGVALSGGGSKSSAFAMGVLSGLHDLDAFSLDAADAAANRPHVEIVSSVSGGGYSAYWLISQLTHAPLSGALMTNQSASFGRDLLDQMFVDCLTQDEDEDPLIRHTSRVRRSLFLPQIERQLSEARCYSRTRYAMAPPGTRPPRGTTFVPVNRYQHLLRCGQDILNPGACIPFATGEDGVSSGLSTAALLVPTLGWAPVHHLANSLFDWGMNVAPSRAAYHDGMGLTYGTTPTAKYHVAMPKDDILNRTTFDCAPGESAKQSASDVSIVASAEVAPLVGCHKEPNGRLRPDAMSFKELSAAWRSGQDGSALRIPFWVIQATAPKYRGIVGTLNATNREIPADTFEFTPLGTGSRRYGFVVGSLQGFDVLDATTSAAAFLDASQSALGGFGVRQALNTAQYLFNASWGEDIPNFSVSPARESFHKVVPFPLNTLDSAVAQLSASGPDERNRVRSAYMRVVDGGNADDTAVFAMLRRGVKVVMFSDGAHDAKVFDDVCTLKNQLATFTSEYPDGGVQRQTVLYLSVPAIGELDQHCPVFDSDGKGYSFWNDWPKNSAALLGCISKIQDATCQDDANTVMRLLIVKPHLSLAAVKEETFHPGIKPCPEHDEYNTCGEGPGEIDEHVRQINACTFNNVLYRNGPALSDDPAPLPIKCDESVEACRTAVPCEVAYKYARQATIPNVRDAKFPQDSTVFITANSSGTLFASYRELARQTVFMSRNALNAALSSDPSSWLAMLKEQASTPIPLQTLPLR